MTVERNYVYIEYPIQLGLQTHPPYCYGELPPPVIGTQKQQKQHAERNTQNAANPRERSKTQINPPQNQLIYKSQQLPILPNPTPQTRKLPNPANPANADAKAAIAVSQTTRQN
ncbi:hypothetical protein N7492_004521 [Penicillium capsulatum]|uniref:Uncharacterized protein n=1 Tax=Penicillium capsulatum TaxID=69766 RepID=A0A9W9IA41_9EURO|nr:hypothetical protein N7492_004521 [Penicillium capsulatum]KAJ6136359.1 hypothetical protein N7512_001519 [Penicillium capsulatum]